MIHHIKHHAKKAQRHVTKYKHHYLLASLIVALGFSLHFALTDRTRVSAAGTEASVIDMEIETEINTQSTNSGTAVAGLKLISPNGDSLTEMSVVLDGAGASPENFNVYRFIYIEEQKITISGDFLL